MADTTNTTNVIDHLCIVGLSYRNLGELESNSYKDITLQFMALASGLQECKEICVVDTSTSIEYFSGSLYKVLVTDGE